MFPISATRRQCPECRVTLTRYEWSRLWWMSSMMSGRLVQPCHECGTRLRLSSMALLTTLSALALIVMAIAYIIYQHAAVLWVGLVLLLLMLVSMQATRLKTAGPRVPPKRVVLPSRDESRR